MPTICSRHSQSNSICSLPKRSTERLPSFRPFSEFATQPKRPVQAETELKPVQQQHVDETVDDSFPASDPPAWTTSGTKSVAAECEPDALNEAPVPPGQELYKGAEETADHLVHQVSSLARDLYHRGEAYLQEGWRHLPEAERYYRRGAQAMSRSLHEHPFAALAAAGTVGFALGWILGTWRTEHGFGPQWRRFYSRRFDTAQQWHPEPRSFEPAHSDRSAAGRRSGKASTPSAPMPQAGSPETLH